MPSSKPLSETPESVENSKCIPREPLHSQLLPALPGAPKGGPCISHPRLTFWDPDPMAKLVALAAELGSLISNFQDQTRHLRCRSRSRRGKQRGARAGLSYLPSARLTHDPAQAVE